MLTCFYTIYTLRGILGECTHNISFNDMLYVKLSQNLVKYKIGKYNDYRCY